MARTAALALVLLGAALAAVAWLVWGGDRDPKPSETPLREETRREDPGPTRLSGDPGTAPAAGSAESPGTPPTDARTGSLDVLVTDETGAPMDGAAVRLRQVGAAGPSHDAESDRGGLARFVAIPVGEYAVTGSRADHDDGYGHVTVGADAPGRTTLRLLSRVEIVGRVLAQRDGRPVAGARVALTRGGSADGKTEVLTGKWASFAETVTDGEGAFSARIPRDRVMTLTASATGYGNSVVSVKRSEPGAEVVLRLPPGGSVRGIVRAPDGSPAPGARVYVVPDGIAAFLEAPWSIAFGGGGWFRSGRDEEESEGGTEWEGEGEIHRAWRARSDEQGRFEVAGMAVPGRVLALAEGADGSRGSTQALDLSEESPVALVDLRLSPRVTLVVRVLAADGAPAASGGNVTLHGIRAHFLDPRGDGQGSVHRHIVEGTARIEGLVGGEYTLQADVRGSAPVEVPVRLPDSGTHDVTIRSKAGRTLRGEVVTEAGSPVGKAKVTWWSEKGPGVIEQRAFLETDASGRFAMENLQDADGTLEVEGDRWLTTTLTDVRPGGDPVRVVLRSLGLLRGHLDPGGGELPSHDAIWIAEHHVGIGRYTLHRTASIAPDGTLRYFVGRTDGPVVLVLVAWDDSPWADVVLGTFRLEPGEEHDAGTIRLDEGRVVRGRVVDGSGAAVADARVAVEVPGAPKVRDGLMTGPERSAKTRADGTFEIARVHRGAALLRATHPAHVSAQLVDSGEPAEVTLRLAPGAFVRGALLRRVGSPVAADVPMRFTRPGVEPGEETYIVTDKDGRFSTPPLTTGSYRFEASPDDRSTWVLLGTVALPEGGTREVEWRLP